MLDSYLSRLTNVLVTFILSGTSLFAVTDDNAVTIDSIKELIATETVDSIKFKHYAELISELSSIDRAATIAPSKVQLSLAIAMGDEKKIAMASLQLGSQYLYLGNSDSAFVYTLRANEYFTEQNDLSNLTENLNNLALLYQRLNRYEEAVKAYQDVIVFSDSLGDFVGEIYAAVNLMSLYMDLKDQEKALEYYKSAITIVEKVPTTSLEVIDELESVYSVIYMNAAICHDELNQLDSAIFYFEKADEALSFITDSYARSYWEGYIKGNLGDIFYKLATKNNAEINDSKSGYLATSLSYAEEANSIFNDIQDDRGRAFTLINIGKTYNELGDYASAEKKLMEGITMSKDIGFRETIRDGYEHLAKNSEYRHDYKNSIIYLHKWLDYRDSISNDERTKLTRGLEVRFETAQKEKEILELGLQNEIAAREQTIQRYIYFTSILLLLGAAYMIFSRFRLKKQKEITDYEKEVNQEMSRFVPMDFIKAIGRSKITDVQLGDQIEKEVTVVFTDIRSFTTISEGMTPQENFAFVKEYAERMGPIIVRNHGFVSQYLGDGIMAIFQNNPTDALLACLEMQEDISEYNKMLVTRGRDPIKVGMGMHTGPLIMGIIGDEIRRDATLISDTVNTAARIESTTKVLEADILLSQDSVKKLVDPKQFFIKPMGEVSVKGKNIPIQVYKCQNSKPDDKVIPIVHISNNN